MIYELYLNKAIIKKYYLVYKFGSICEVKNGNPIFAIPLHFFNNLEYWKASFCLLAHCISFSVHSLTASCVHFNVWLF